MIGVLNNEAAGLIAIQSVLAIVSRINIANSYLILPLLFDKKIRGYLKRKNTKVLSVQELTITKSELFIGFNDKYSDSLVVTTNAIAMGIEFGLIRLSSNYLAESVPFSLDKGSVGGKVDEFVSASKNISTMLSEPPEFVYSLMRVEV